MKLPELMNALSSLSAKDLKVVRSEVERLLAGYSKIDEPLYQAVQHVLGANMPLSQFERSTYLKHWAKTQVKVLDFLEEWAKGLKRGRGDDYKLKVFLMNLTYKHLLKVKVPPSIGAMAIHMGNIDMHFDEAFPRYRVSGVADLVVHWVLERKYT